MVYADGSVWEEEEEDKVGKEEMGSVELGFVFGFYFGPSSSLESPIIYPYE